MNILLTGVPGCGKSTAINKIIEVITRQTKSGEFQHAVSGFVTTEIKVGSQREGFEIVTLTNKRGLLAHINHSKQYPLFMVGKYGVDVDTFESIALEELHKPTRVCIIDEIGKMETHFSKKFNNEVKRLLDDPNVFVVGTIALHGGGFIAEVKKRKDIKIIELTQANRELLPENIVIEISKKLAPEK